MRKTSMKAASSDSAKIGLHVWLSPALENWLEQYPSGGQCILEALQNLPLKETKEFQVDLELQATSIAVEKCRKSKRRQQKTHSDKRRQQKTWRCSEKSCYEVVASDWGKESEVQLAGHIVFYHRSSRQYYDLMDKHWSEEIAS